MSQCGDVPGVAASWRCGLEGSPMDTEMGVSVGGGEGAGGWGAMGGMGGMG